MIKPMDVTPEVSEALALLRTFAGPDGGKFLPGQIVQAFNVLDNKGVFAEIDEANDYASAEEILAESAVRSLNEELGKPDPEEWGDTTRADMAQHVMQERIGAALQDDEDNPPVVDPYALTGTGHDRSVCDADPLASPSQHSGTCPTWARHHNL